ncbi:MULTISPECIES: ADP-ribosyltransferase [Bacillus]|nr:ADP-ribosyltransferase [Bacillus pseudomycoides]EEM10565.1 Mono-ADP-ribosyltransferase C3 [Bacillus pseudomycoides]MED0856796.1 ADP-ribosyltransferase [Bacillus pseudomycoides]MED1474992.1 ADP-ribosyltransferase [Bacillus pseudomycoides]MED1594345.1 ADP-ribosyltransferase [Bacillus pseudomycoides]MED4714031.1 ADP-ribosyltransferase [Bacillus pseudomycoides]
MQDGKNIRLDRVRLESLKAEKYGNEKMYQLGGRMAEGVDYIGKSIGKVPAENGNVLKTKTVQSFENLNLNGEAKKPLSNLEEAHEWGSKHFDNWIESLTESERSAIRQYTGDDYRKINNYLRGIADSLNDVESSVIDNIKSGLNKASVPYDIQVYRGTDLKPFKNLYKIDDEGKIVVDSLVGKTVKDNGFVSTAMVKESSFDHMNVSWEINVPKGANAAYVGKISYIPTEAELLFNSGQEMVIKSANVDSDGKIHLILDLIK